MGKAFGILKNSKRIAKTLERATKALKTFFKESKWADSTIKKAGSCAVQPHSFARGTKVVLADGETESIENLKEGDRVLATDPETGKTTARPVTATHTNLDIDLTELTVTHGDGNTATLPTTQHHPFWSETRGSWINAGDLRPGERLLALDRRPATVARAHNYTGSSLMHDLTVSDVHTYYVVVGVNPVLVHNTDSSCPIHGGPTGVPTRDLWGVCGFKGVSGLTCRALCLVRRVP
ncbi:polymorphic toxin-type HINT domain-containing protein [Micromonospora sp. NPDC050417]|uniref:polymorphic toxin-type HINT domain-containing protein n=1 Tax=Micromonospora sp. NPDC050417 TaxID=3364280 RepID=UPI0037874FE3